MKNIGILSLTLLLCVSIFLLAGSPVSSQQSDTRQQTVAKGPEAGDGASLVESKCSVCHGTDKVKKAKKDRNGWENTVNRMISKGAQLTETEKKVLIDYLAKKYPSK